MEGIQSPLLDIALEIVSKVRDKRGYVIQENPLTYTFAHGAVRHHMRFGVLPNIDCLTIYEEHQHSEGKKTPVDFIIYHNQTNQIIPNRKEFVERMVARALGKCKW